MRSARSAWKVTVLCGLAAVLAGACDSSRKETAKASSHPTEAPAAKEMPAAVTETPESSPLDGHYERQGTGVDEASLDILGISPTRVRVKGFAEWVGNAETGDVHTGDFSGVAHVEQKKAHYEDNSGCALDITFAADGLTVTNTAQCGGMNVTFDGKYDKTGPPVMASEPR